MVAYDKKDGVAVAFHRKLEGKTLKFKPASRDKQGRPLMEDVTTKSRWLAITGRCVGGLLQGSQVRQITATPILTRRYPSFYPQGDVFKKTSPPKK